MQIMNGVVYLDDVAGTTPGARETSYRDKDHNQVVIPNVVIIHELLKFDLERQGIDFEKHCQKLFQEAELNNVFRSF
jgi:hypothetical protein